VKLAIQKYASTSPGEFPNVMKLLKCVGSLVTTVPQCTAVVLPLPA